MHSLLTGWLNSSYPKNINYLIVIAKSKVKPIVLKSEKEQQLFNTNAKIRGTMSIEREINIRSKELVTKRKVMKI